jgi:RNA-directed DNA polymerase
MDGTLGPQAVSTRLQRIAELARKAPDMVLTTLAHHINMDLMHEAYRRTRKNAAAGVDGQTAKEFEARLQEHLAELLEGLKSGSYRAPPVRRTYIPKGDGKSLRPLGIPTFADRVMQRAVHMVLEAVYEQSFLDCSFGFRPGRSAQQALDVIRETLMEMGGGWICDGDIRKFFDTLDHQHLRAILDLRVRDGVIRKAIDKWLKAGVLEEGQLHHPDEGTPQGGVISPLLANIFLHEVLDKWFENEVKPRLRGKARLIRYADDFVIIVEREDEAKVIMSVLPKRLAKYGLELHPDKTRLVEFRSPRRRNGDSDDDGPGSFNFLGFTHYWGETRRGGWAVKAKTASDRFTRAVHKVWEWCRSARHESVPEQHRQLKAKLRGHYGYYGRRGNSKGVSRFLYEVERCWFAWLRRRSEHRHLTWEKYRKLLTRFLLPRPPRLSVANP